MALSLPSAGFPLSAMCLGAGPARTKKAPNAVGTGRDHTVRAPLCGAFKHADSLMLHEEKRGKRQRWGIWHKHTREAPGTESKLGMCVGPACWARKKSGSRIPGSGPCCDERGEGMPVLGVSER